jgi:hypothetical protein
MRQDARAVGQHEISHVVERKGAFETVHRQPTVRKDVPCVVDEHVDAGLLGVDAGADLLGVAEGQQVCNMGVVRDLRRGLTEPGQCAFCPRLVAGEEDNPGALSCAGLSRDLPNPRRGPGDDDDLSVHPVQPDFISAFVGPMFLIAQLAPRRKTLGLTDRAYIIYSGEVLMEGDAHEIVNNPDVRRLYLGEEFRM